MSNYFYKYIKSDLEKNSNFENYLLSSGLKFNKLDIEINLNEEYSKKNLALELDSDINPIMLRATNEKNNKIRTNKDWLDQKGRAVL